MGMTQTADLSLSDAEPLAIRAAVTAFVAGVLHVFVIAGPLPLELEAPIVSAVDLGALLVLLILARRKVVAAAKVVTRRTTAGQLVAGEAATVPTGTPVAVLTTSDGARVSAPVPVAVESTTGPLAEHRADVPTDSPSTEGGPLGGGRV